MASAAKTKKPTRQFLVDEKGQRTAVLLPIKEYEEIIERLEDLEDIHAAEEARAEGGATITLEELEDRLRTEGKID